MISYIKGKLVYKGLDFVIVDNNGIGYNIQTSAGILERLPAVGENVKIYTFMSVKDDGISLFGFTSMAEIDMFNKLLKVSGVGPKSAAGLIGAFTPNSLSIAIASGDDKLISTGPGIGKKTAQKIILELKDKISTEDMFGGESVSAGKINVDSSEVSDATAALEALGFGRTEALSAVGSIDTENLTSGEIVSAALKKLKKF